MNSDTPAPIGSVKKIGQDMTLTLAAEAWPQMVDDGEYPLYFSLPTDPFCDTTLLDKLRVAEENKGFLQQRMLLLAKELELANTKIADLRKAADARRRTATAEWPAALLQLSERSMLGITIRYRREPKGVTWPAPWQVSHHSTKWIDACQTAYGNTMEEALRALLDVLHEKVEWMGGWPTLAVETKEAT